MNEPKLTEAQAISDYERLKIIIATNSGSAICFLNALMEVREKGYWIRDAKTWPEWCQQFVGRNWDTLRKKLWRIQQKANERLIKQTTGEPIERSVQREPTPFIQQFSKAEKILSQVSARRDIELPILPVPHEPYPEPVKPHVVNPTPVPPDAISMIQQASTALAHLMRETIFATNPEFRKVVRLVESVKEMIQPEFSFTHGLTARQKSRGTRQELREFCENIGLQASDGDWFFDKAEGCGWKNNKVPIVDWRSTCRAWKTSSVFPSQKAPAVKPVNGHQVPGVLSGAEMMVRQSELQDCQKAIDTIKNSYDSHQSMRPQDRERLAKLAARRKELHALLGRQV